MFKPLTLHYISLSVSLNGGGGGGGGEFLKKLWCCITGKYNKVIWLYQLG